MQIFVLRRLLTFALVASFFLIMLAQHAKGGQRLCENDARLCVTGLCKIEECLVCNRKTAICTTTISDHLIPDKLENFTEFLEVTYLGPDTMLKQSMFAQYLHLKNITITGSNITGIEPNTFLKQLNLKWLTIAGSKIYELPDELFCTNNKLEDFNFPHNQFTKVPVNVFPKIELIRNIDLSYNPLETVTGNQSTIAPEFEHLKGLQKLNLAGYGISEMHCKNLSEGYLRPVAQITALDLSESFLFFADQKILSPLMKLNTLIIHNVEPYRSCPALAKDMFSYLPAHLSTLRFQHWSTTLAANSSCFLGYEELSGLRRLPRLSTLDTRYSDKLFGNILIKSLFEGFQDMKVLFIGWCGISQIDDGAIATLKKLSDFSLRGNLLGSRIFWPNGVNKSSNLVSLDLISLGMQADSYNLTALLTSFPNLTSLYLDANQLKRLPTFRKEDLNETISFKHRTSKTLFSNLTSKLSNLRMNDNLITSFAGADAVALCQIMPLLKTVDIENNRLTVITDVCRSLRILSLANNHIGRRQTENLNALANLVDLEHLDISANQIDSLPKSIFSKMPGLKVLILANNNIKSLDIGSFSSLTSLRSLDLSSNLLSVLNETMFSNLTKLTGFYLQACGITAIPSGLIDLVNNTMTELKRFGIAGNPLICSCDNKLKNWIWASEIIIQAKNITCRKPEKEDIFIQLISYNPDRYYCFIRYPLMIALSATVGIVLSLLIGVPCYKYRWYIGNIRIVTRAIVNRIQEVRFVQRSRYDAFISYSVDSDSDTNWVKNFLIPNIENQMSGEEKFKLFVADRDSQIGSYRYTELCEAAEDSRKIIILLSNSYITNATCLREAELLAGIGMVDGGQSYQPNRFLVMIIEELDEASIRAPITSLLTEHVVDVVNKCHDENTWKRVKKFIKKPKYIYQKPGKIKRRPLIVGAGGDDETASLLPDNQME